MMCDIDLDGDLDIYVTGIYNVQPLLFANTHNILLRNDSDLGRGHLRFNDIATPLEVADTSWGWGTTFTDADNDGWQDLYTPNGFVSGKTMDDT